MENYFMSDSIEKIIFDTIDQINDDLGVNIIKASDSDLVGGESPLDSLGVITLLMELENNIEDSFGIELTLVNDDVLSNEKNPLSNVNTLKIHLEKIINAK